MSKISYASAIVCLMYVIDCTRSNLAHKVSQMCKFMFKPEKQHWEEVKWVLRYLKGTTGLGVMSNMKQGVPSVVRHMDSDYASDLGDRRSTIGYVFTLVEGPIYWK